MSQPILLIFGVGKNIGAATVKKFLSNGYRVASATRSAKPDDSDTEKLLLPCDITKPDTVSAAFASVRKTWGEPSVVIFNAATAHFGQADDALASVSVPDFTDDITGSVISGFVAARESVASFKELPGTASRTFMYTGNLLNEGKAMPGLLTLGVGKSAAAYLVSEASESYKPKGYRFYYVDERVESGALKGRAISGTAHADFFLALAEGKAGDVPWQATFVEGIGYKKFAKPE